MAVNFCFTGKRALVTGASRGIGKHIAMTLSDCGAEVYGIGKDKELLEQLSKESPGIKHIALDLSNWKDAESVVRCAGPFDLLVNCAGISIVGPLINIKEEDLEKVMGVNVKATINVTKVVIKGMIENKISGSIVNISSQASMVGLFDHALYCASKAAIDGFTRCAALEYGRNNIRVNAVNPTVIMTEMGKMAWSDPKIAEPMLAKIPLGRFGEVHEVTYPVLFLLSERASLITGVCLPIDAGYTSS